MCFRRSGIGGEEVRAKRFYGSLKIRVAPLGCRRFAFIGVLINTRARRYRNVEKFITMVYLIAVPIQVVVAS